MARKKQEIHPAIILGAIGLVIFGPIALCAAVYFAIRCLFLPRTLSRGYLYPEDADRLGQKIEALDRQIERVKAIGRAYDLPFRQDGWLDARNSRGRELNAKLEMLESERENSIQFLYNIEAKAARLLNVWSFNHAGRFASFISVGIYLLSIVLLRRSYPETSPLAWAFMAGLASLVGGTAAFFVKQRSLQRQFGNSAFPSDSAGDRGPFDEERRHSGDAEEPKFSDWQPHADKTEEQSRREEKSCFDVLGVAPDASLQQIKAAYRNAIKQYHPDFVAALGPELRELAEVKTKELNKAYYEATHRTTNQ